MKELFAFWRYDSFPYVLGGHVTKMSESGLVETKEYGRQQWFRPIILLPKNTGEKIQSELRKLRDEKYKADAECCRKFLEKATKILPEIK